jgi:hypothetical protein
MARIPIAGTIDFKWFALGIAFAMFILPMLMGLLSKGRRTKPAA